MRNPTHRADHIHTPWTIGPARMEQGDADQLTSCPDGNAGACPVCDTEEQKA